MECSILQGHFEATVPQLALAFRPISYQSLHPTPMLMAAVMYANTSVAVSTIYGKV